VHSYYPDPLQPGDVALTSDHGQQFCAAVRRGNVFGTQFHPEKSQAAGLALLRGFASA
jgi:glutamine amidotransferase